MVYSLLWVMQDFYHQPYPRCAGSRKQSPLLSHAAVPQEAFKHASRAAVVVRTQTQALMKGSEECRGPPLCKDPLKPPPERNGSVSLRSCGQQHPKLLVAVPGHPGRIVSASPQRDMLPMHLSQCKQHKRPVQSIRWPATFAGAGARLYTAIQHASGEQYLDFVNWQKLCGR